MILSPVGEILKLPKLLANKGAKCPDGTLSRNCTGRTIVGDPYVDNKYYGSFVAISVEHTKQKSNAAPLVCHESM